MSSSDFELSIMFNGRQFKKRAHNITTVEGMRRFILNSIEPSDDFKHTKFNIEYFDGLFGEYCSLVNTLEYLKYFNSKKDCHAIPVLIRVTAVATLNQEKDNASSNGLIGTFPTPLPQSYNNSNNNNNPVVNGSPEQNCVTGTDHNHAASHVTETCSNSSQIEIEIYYSASRNKKEEPLLRLKVGERDSFKQMRQFLFNKKVLKSFPIHDMLFLYYKASDGSKVQITDNNQTVWSFLREKGRGDNPPKFLFSVYK